MKVLLLGGTNEAIKLAQDLQDSDVELIYSLAGLVRQPDLKCRVVSGGFSQIGGFQKFLETESIDHVFDATHPYASKMSQQAVDTCRDLEIPCWRYVRPPWEAKDEDNWHEFVAWEHLSHALVDHQAVLFTAGRLSQEFVDDLYQWTRNTVQRQWLRSATKPAFSLPPSMTWIEAIGPYDLDPERDLLDRFKIDAVVCKNSGGTHASAKLEAARERGIPVYMLCRPELVEVDQEFDDIDAGRDALLKLVS
ncbi:MAG: precorrin-6A/cobalt-precorrin-6A reductase [Pseudomonadota bacterium]